MHPEWLEAFDQIVELSTASLPQDESVKWTYLTAPQIAKQLSDLGLTISCYQVRQMLNRRSYKSRKTLKMKALSQTENRNE